MFSINTREFESAIKFNKLQSLKDTQEGYIWQKYTLEKYAFGNYNFGKYTFGKIFSENAL